MVSFNPVKSALTLTLAFSEHRGLEPLSFPRPSPHIGEIQVGFSVNSRILSSMYNPEGCCSFPKMPLNQFIYSLNNIPSVSVLVLCQCSCFLSGCLPNIWIFKEYNNMRKANTLRFCFVWFFFFWFERLVSVKTMFQGSLIEFWTLSQPFIAGSNQHKGSTGYYFFMQVYVEEMITASLHTSEVINSWKAWV